MHSERLLKLNLEMIAADASLVLLCLQQQEIIGCVHLQKKQDATYLGMFVVRPVLQGAGIGKYFMHIAETHAQQL